MPGFWWSLLSAILAIAVGAIMIGRPISGAFSLTFLLIAFFLIEGIASIMFALDHRRYLAGAWGWMLASGIVDLLIVGVVFAQLPGSGLWALGTLLGINLIIGGIALVAMAYRHAGSTQACLLRTKARRLNWPNTRRAARLCATPPPGHLGGGGGCGRGCPQHPWRYRHRPDRHVPGPQRTAHLACQNSTAPPCDLLS